MTYNNEHKEIIKLLEYYNKEYSSKEYYRILKEKRISL